MSFASRVRRVSPLASAAAGIRRGVGGVLADHQPVLRVAERAKHAVQLHETLHAALAFPRGARRARRPQRRHARAAVAPPPRLSLLLVRHDVGGGDGDAHLPVLGVHRVASRRRLREGDADARHERGKVPVRAPLRRGVQVQHQQRTPERRAVATGGARRSRREHILERRSRRRVETRAAARGGIRGIRFCFCFCFCGIRFCFCWAIRERAGRAGRRRRSANDLAVLVLRERAVLVLLLRAGPKHEHGRGLRRRLSPPRGVARVASAHARRPRPGREPGAGAVLLDGSENGELGGVPWRPRERRAVPGERRRAARLRLVAEAERRRRGQDDGKAGVEEARAHRRARRRRAHEGDRTTRGVSRAGVSRAGVRCAVFAVFFARRFVRAGPPRARFRLARLLVAANEPRDGWFTRALCALSRDGRTAVDQNARRARVHASRHRERATRRSRDGFLFVRRDRSVVAIDPPRTRGDASRRRARGAPPPPRRRRNTAFFAWCRHGRFVTKGSFVRLRRVRRVRRGRY